jgi:homeobox-leucine zipper protein
MEENWRLHKELAELHALKTAPPFFMRLLATTLSLCLSCEPWRVKAAAAQHQQAPD